MLFSSIVFVFVFLPLVLALYLLLPFKNLMLLLASLLFFGWGEGIYVAVMLVSIILNYAVGRLVGGWSKNPRTWLVIGVSANLWLLGFFKYGNFIVENLNALFAVIGLPEVHMAPVHLPIGISFFTFQGLAYVIDVYRGDVPPQRKLTDLALYIALFPQLIAGPIVRYKDIAGQLNRRIITTSRFTYGINRFLAGLGKKVIFANSFGEAADQIFALPVSSLSIGLSWAGVVCYSLQIYFDFSGYSDMAVGLGRMFGFRFMENFNYPYISQSVREFWRRWHISLSTWFRDYLYIPLGGSRCSRPRAYFNLFVVFFLCGLWHGASWNFVIWGLFHGLALVVERAGFGAVLERAWRPLRHIYLLLFVAVAWVFFRAETVGDAAGFLSAMFGLAGSGSAAFETYITGKIGWLLLFAAIGATPLPLQLLKGLERNGNSPLCLYLPPMLRIGVLSVAFVLSVMLLAAGTHNPFIYFRF